MSSSADFDKLTSTYHADQLEGLGAVLARLGSLSTEEVRELLPNVVRHLERSGYPSVVGKSIELSPGPRTEARRKIRKRKEKLSCPRPV